MNAYNKIYLNDAQNLLAAMLDYAVNSLKYHLDFFYNMFLTSSYCERFEDGDALVVAGMSGIELAKRVVEEKAGMVITTKPTYEFGKSPEYWAGWALAYYQWNCGDSFAKINGEVDIQEIVEMYNPYHEMDIHHFVDNMNEQRCKDINKAQVDYVIRLSKALECSVEDILEVSVD